MKHCQITGVEMPDEVDLRDKCGPVQDQGSFGSATSIAHASMVEASAEFPEAEFQDWINRQAEERKPLTKRASACWGFDRGRASK